MTSVAIRSITLDLVRLQETLVATRHSSADMSSGVYRAPRLDVVATPERGLNMEARWAVLRDMHEAGAAVDAILAEQGESEHPFASTPAQIADRPPLHPSSHFSHAPHSTSASYEEQLEVRRARLERLTAALTPGKRASSAAAAALPPSPAPTPASGTAGTPAAMGLQPTSLSFADRVAAAAAAAPVSSKTDRFSGRTPAFEAPAAPAHAPAPYAPSAAAAATPAPGQPARFSSLAHTLQRMTDLAAQLRTSTDEVAAAAVAAEAEGSGAYTHAPVHAHAHAYDAPCEHVEHCPHCQQRQLLLQQEQEQLRASVASSPLASPSRARIATSSGSGSGMNNSVRLTASEADVDGRGDYGGGSRLARLSAGLQVQPVDAVTAQSAATARYAPAEAVGVNDTAADASLLLQQVYSARNSVGGGMAAATATAAAGAALPSATITGGFPFPSASYVPAAPTLNEYLRELSGVHAWQESALRELRRQHDSVVGLASPIPAPPVRFGHAPPPTPYTPASTSLAAAAAVVAAAHGVTGANFTAPSASPVPAALPPFTPGGALHGRPMLPPSPFGSAVRRATDGLPESVASLLAPRGMGQPLPPSPGPRYALQRAQELLQQQREFEQQRLARHPYQEEQQQYDERELYQQQQQQRGAADAAAAALFSPAPPPVPPSSYQHSTAAAAAAAAAASPEALGLGLDPSTRREQMKAYLRELAASLDAEQEEEQAQATEQVHYAKQTQHRGEEDAKRKQVAVQRQEELPPTPVAAQVEQLGVPVKYRYVVAEADGSAEYDDEAVEEQELWKQQQTEQQQRERELQQREQQQRERELQQREEELQQRERELQRRQQQLQQLQQEKEQQEEEEEQDGGHYAAADPASLSSAAAHMTDGSSNSSSRAGFAHSTAARKPGFAAIRAPQPPPPRRAPAPAPAPAPPAYEEDEEEDEEEEEEVQVQQNVQVEAEAGDNAEEEEEEQEEAQEEEQDFEDEEAAEQEEDAEEVEPFYTPRPHANDPALKAAAAAAIAASSAAAAEADAARAKQQSQAQTQAQREATLAAVTGIAEKKSDKSKAGVNDDDDDDDDDDSEPETPVAEHHAPVPSIVPPLATHAAPLGSPPSAAGGAGSTAGANAHVAAATPAHAPAPAAVPGPDYFHTGWTGVLTPQPTPRYIPPGAKVFGKKVVTQAELVEVYKAMLSLLNGVVFRKHGRWGFPHARVVWIDATGDALLLRWGPVDLGVTNEEAPFVSLEEVQGVEVGRSTKVLIRSGKAAHAGRYWSILCYKRTLDLEAANNEQAAWWSNNFKKIMAIPGLLQHAMLYLYENGAWKPQQQMAQTPRRPPQPLHET